jgi:hypothetical protein
MATTSANQTQVPSIHEKVAKFCQIGEIRELYKSTRAAPLYDRADPNADGANSF